MNRVAAQRAQGIHPVDNHLHDLRAQLCPEDVPVRRDYVLDCLPVRQVQRAGPHREPQVACAEHDKPEPLPAGVEPLQVRMAPRHTGSFSQPSPPAAPRMLRCAHRRTARSPAPPGCSRRRTWTAAAHRTGPRSGSCARTRRTGSHPGARPRRPPGNARARRYAGSAGASSPAAGSARAHSWPGQDGGCVRPAVPVPAAGGVGTGVMRGKVARTSPPGAVGGIVLSTRISPPGGSPISIVTS